MNPTTAEQFFHWLTLSADPGFEKLTTDTRDNWLREGSLTPGRARWLRKALQIKRKAMIQADVSVPEDIQRFLERDLEDSEQPQAAHTPVPTGNSVSYPQGWRQAQATQGLEQAVRELAQVCGELVPLLRKLSGDRA